MKILLYDLEVTPILGWTYGTYDTNVIRIERDSYIMCFSYKWYGNDRIINVSQPNMESYKDDMYDDRELVGQLWRLMDVADVVVAHNANRFDNRIATARFLHHGLGPPSPYKSVDTLQIARRYFRFTSNALNNLCQQLEIGSKPPETHGKLWRGCVDGDMKSWKLMSRYCNRDVELLDGLYTTLLPYIKNHPNMANDGNPDVCPKCGGTELHYRGYAHTSVATYRRVQCQECGGWSRERVADKSIQPPTFVNEQ